MSRNSAAVSAEPERPPEICTCLAVRQAARHVTQFYDQQLAPIGLRTTQYSILAKLNRLGPMSVNALADAMVMDRTTLGRNIKPLQRLKLVAVRRGREDARVKEVHLTDSGSERFRRAEKLWAGAQQQFDHAFGAGNSSDLRALMRTITAVDFTSAEPHTQV